jgi:glycosyltransferase involved in cell wall biosynthesis
MNPPQLSIVSPVYHAGSIVDELVRRIVEAAGSVTPDFEIILVDDASADDSWARIVAAADKDPRVRGLRLSRNFGQHRAITAGLAQARGEHVVVMDCDLQDDPRFIPALVAKAREGFDVVLTTRVTRQHSWFRNFTAGLFFRIFNLLTDWRPTDRRIGGFSIISRKVVTAYLRIGDVHRHYLLILGWLGFPQAVIPVEHGQRHSGRSTYTFGRLVRHALEGITSQSTRLLRISIGIGFAYVVTAALGVVYLVVSYYLHGFRAGWASTMVLLLGSTGLILMAIGILGIYLGNVFDQVRARPLYLVQDSVNFEAAPE